MPNLRCLGLCGLYAFIGKKLSKSEGAMPRCPPTESLFSVNKFYFS